MTFIDITLKRGKQEVELTVHGQMEADVGEKNVPSLERSSSVGREDRSRTT